MPIVYWTILVCWATGYLFRIKGIPDGAKTEFIVRVFILIAGCVTDFFLIPTSHVYALGTGLISAVISIVSYDMILKVIEQKFMALLGRIFGTSQKPNEPLEYDTVNVTETKVIHPKP